jgi:hypothetical protein
MQLTLKSIAHHRNGISGEPFYAVLFTMKEAGYPPRNMVASYFPGERLNCYCAVLDVDMLTAGNVTFGENSWRGDRYADQIKTWIEERNRQAA